MRKAVVTSLVMPMVAKAPEKPGKPDKPVAAAPIILTQTPNKADAAAAMKDPPKVETPTKIESARTDPHKVDPPKIDPPKVDPPKIDPPKGVNQPVSPVGTKPNPY